ncbi:MAG: hypothetical protein HY741_14120 [Chloroflexi bacterium]|nr:hypothetical protein [Chloroflexota bacterium]
MSGTKSASSNGATKRNRTRGSATKAKTRATRKPIQSLTPQDALQLLASAVSYCQQAGLEVYATNTLDGLRFYIPQARYVATPSGGAAFVLESAPTLRPPFAAI